MAEERFIIERAAEYSVQPQYRPTVVESHLSKYVLEVDPLAFDKDRASFSYRSPGLGTLQSSQVELCFTIKIESKQQIGYVSTMGPQIMMVNSQAATGGAAQYTAALGTSVQGPSCKLAFGSGDCLQKCISSLQVVVNGAAISQTRQRDYMRSLQKAWFDKSVFQKRFCQAGGTPQQYDSVAVQGEVHAGGATPVVSGFTGDSGVRDQLKNLLGCTIELVNGDNNGADSDIRYYRIRTKINGTGLFSPLGRGDRVSSSCPYRQSARALPHMNVVSINILFQDLFKGLVRNLSTWMDGANGDIAGGGDNDIEVSFPPDGPDAKLFVEFLRLPSWRQQNEVALLQTFRVAVHDPTNDIVTNTTTFHQDGLDGSVPIDKVLVACGQDRYQGQGAAFRNTGNAGVAGQAQSFRECTWNGLTSAQLPQFLFCVLEKDLATTIHASLDDVNLINQTDGTQYIGGAAGGNRFDSACAIQFAARNTDANAAITQFSLEIMSVQGSYVYSSRAWPWLKTRSDIYRDVSKYCVDSYDDMDTWFKHNCIVLLGVAEFAKGISTSGCAFPCTFKVKARFENFRNYVDGYSCASTTGNTLAACQDLIYGRPVLGMIFPQQSLQINASSALLSSQNISHSSAIELLSRR